MNLVEFLKVHRKIHPPLRDAYGEWLGYEIDSVDEQQGMVRTRLAIRHDHLSPSGAVHGGVVSGFCDFTCGCAVFALLERDQFCSTVDLNVKYFSPLQEGDQVVAEATVVHKGRSLSSVVARLFKNGEHDRLMALASGTFNIYRVKNPPRQ